MCGSKVESRTSVEVWTYNLFGFWENLGLLQKLWDWIQMYWLVFLCLCFVLFYVFLLISLYHSHFFLLVFPQHTERMQNDVLKSTATDFPRSRSRLDLPISSSQEVLNDSYWGLQFPPVWFMRKYRKVKEIKKLRAACVDTLRTLMFPVFSCASHYSCFLHCLIHLCSWWSVC